MKCHHCQGLCIKHGLLKEVQRYKCKQCKRTQLESYVNKAWIPDKKKLFKRCLERNAGAVDLNSAQKQLKDLGDDLNATFTFEENKDGTNVSEIRMDANGVVVIPFFSNANAIHEATHAYQHLNGNITLIRGGGVDDYDVTDEVAAYQRQFYFSPPTVLTIQLSNSKIESFKDINIHNIRNIKTYKKDGTVDYRYINLPTSPINRPGSPADKK